MAIETIKAGSRFYRIKDGIQAISGFPFLEIGPAGTTQLVSTMMVQLNPSEAWSGSLIPVARIMGAAANDVDTPFEPIPYRVGSLANIAQITDGLGWPWSLAPLTGPAIIAIPANGLSIAFLVSRDAGELDVTSWDLHGGSAM